VDCSTDNYQDLVIFYSNAANLFSNLPKLIMKAGKVWLFFCGKSYFNNSAYLIYVSILFFAVAQKSSRIAISQSTLKSNWPGKPSYAIIIATVSQKKSFTTPSAL